MNPFKDATKMYRTGDLGKWLPDGSIEFLGRIDYQVKVRGFRIELEEIEGQLMAHNDIKEAAVIVRNNESGNGLLCAYVVSDKIIDTDEIRNHLKNNLPEYMIPSYFKQLDILPLSLSGKVDRKSLLNVTNEGETVSKHEVATNVLEEKLVEIWKEVLGKEGIGINDNFFDLGGYSLHW